MREHWTLDPDVTYLNHGAFGACPRAVLEFQSRIRAELEREPVQFFGEFLETRQEEARADVASFVGANPEVPKRLVRVAAQLYNTPSDFERLAAALSTELGSPP